MFSRIKNFFNTMTMHPRDRYLREAVDLADLEQRQRRWDKSGLDRSNYYHYFGF